MERSQPHLPPGAHVCLLYDNFDAQRQAVLPFIREGLALGEQVYYVADEQSADDWLFEFQIAGVDVERERAKGALIVCEGEHWRTPGTFSSMNNARAGT
jgi:hypothetical protein